MMNKLSDYFRVSLDQEDDFLNCYHRVIKWNLTANNGKCNYSENSIKQQYILVKEEAEELLKAIKEKNAIDFLDAWCDLFVVLSYYVHLTQNSGVIRFVSFKGIISINEIVEDILSCPDLFALNDVCTALHTYKGDGYHALLEVLDSNDSKFPSVKNYRDEKELEKECAEIELKSKGRYKNVTYTIYNGLVIFKDSNNKIMKPSSYREPNLLPYICQ